MIFHSTQLITLKHLKKKTAVSVCGMGVLWFPLGLKKNCLFPVTKWWNRVQNYIECLFSYKSACFVPVFCLNGSLKGWKNLMVWIILSKRLVRVGYRKQTTVSRPSVKELKTMSWSKEGEVLLCNTFQVSYECWCSETRQWMNLVFHCYLFIVFFLTECCAGIGMITMRS